MAIEHGAKGPSWVEVFEDAVDAGVVFDIPGAVANALRTAAGSAASALRHSVGGTALGVAGFFDRLDLNS